MSMLFKGLAQTVDSAIDFQIIALLIIFLFFVATAIIVIRRPNSYYKEVSEEPLHDDLKNDSIK